MQRERCAYLHDLDQAADALFAFTAGETADSIDTNDLLRSAVERKFEIIGEALRQCSRLYPGSVDSLPDLKEAIGQRNVIAHEYFDVDHLILWDSLQNYLPDFQKRVKDLIAATCEGN